MNSLTFLGDAMGRPVAEAILAEPDRWDLSSLVAVSNGAAPLSEGVRERDPPGAARPLHPRLLRRLGVRRHGVSDRRRLRGPLGAPQVRAPVPTSRSSTRT